MNNYETSDLGLIAALSLFIRWESIDDSNPRRVVFVFKESPELLEMVDQYYNDELNVSAYSYSQKIKQIKARLYSQAKGFLYK